MIKKLKDPALYAAIKTFLTVYMPSIRNKSDNTIASYRFTINLYLNFIQDTDKKVLADITSADFRQDKILCFIKWLEYKRTNEVTTINIRLSNIRFLCNYLTLKGIISISDMNDILQISKLPDLRKRDMHFLTIDEVKLVLSQPDLAKKTGIRDKFFIALLYDSGCRDQEILDLKVNDLRLERNGDATLHIIGKGRKFRAIPISKEVVKLFHSYCRIYHPNAGIAYKNYLFYINRSECISQMSPDNVQRFLKTYEEKIKKSKQDIKPLHPHLFRHTRAMHLYMAGVSLPLISEWLGHSNMETSLIYAQASIEMKRKAAEKLMEGNNAVFDSDIIFKYANDDETIRKLSGL